MRLRFRTLILGLILVLLPTLVVPVFSPWSRINCREQEIDLLSGLRQDTQYIYWVPLSRKITGTLVSNALSVEESAERTHQWKQVNSFGPYTHHSPHYIYHGAFSQIDQLQLIWDVFEMGVAERQASANGLLREWQTSGSDSGADDYLREQMKIAEQVMPLNRP